MHTPSVLFENHDISLLSAFKTRAIAAYYFEVHTREDIGYLSEIFAFSEQKKIPMMVIGSGTNCLFAFDRYEGILIRNKYAGHGAIEEKDGKKVITVKSGELSTTLAIDLAQKHETQTLVPWVGLPGTMGGALIGNAGCFGLEMSDILIEAHILDLTTDEVRTYSRADMQYAYRESVLKGAGQYFAIDMLLDLTPRSTPYEAYNPTELQQIRREKQPPGLSCGSFFTNPFGYSAGKLIDEAGLKGYRVGGVQISEHHGNFFLNNEKGTWSDVLALRDSVKKIVLEKHGIELHEEVRIISDSH